ncbi:hypothetical protein KIN20_033953 [Parelaphostrongylus tenuis]|uniref:Uncharacterized protein n=1 Tax=Parelaphostrongylus tenuis TaxID=148309 RepID=A0AAD5R9K4_PARTN|nr:hypothetical protein KIN20_033953 [Parelaphostrongylus tenuis]
MSSPGNPNEHTRPCPCPCQSASMVLVLISGNHRSDHQYLSSNASPHYHMPFHSPFVDPVGSIVCLRVLHLNGKLCYVPIEPELNCMINQQFGNCVCAHDLETANFSPTTNNVMERNDAAFMQSRRKTKPSQPYNNSENFACEIPTVNSTPQRMTVNTQEEIGADGPSWTVPHPQPQSGVRRSRLWLGEMNQTPQNWPPFSNSEDRPVVPFNGSVSMPNLSKKDVSGSEQHKMELLKQIEENKRRRELEKEWERKEEEREIKREVVLDERIETNHAEEGILQLVKTLTIGSSWATWRLERYNEKIRQEEEEEKRKLKERAIKLERQSQEVMENIRNRTSSHPVRSSPLPPEREQRNSSSNSNESRLEWWEKKPTWQEKVRTIAAALSSQLYDRNQIQEEVPELRRDDHRTITTLPFLSRSISRSTLEHIKAHNIVIKKHNSQWNSENSEEKMPTRSSSRMSRQGKQPNRQVSEGEYTNTSGTGNHSGNVAKERLRHFEDVTRLIGLLFVSVRRSERGGPPHCVLMSNN